MIIKILTLGDVVGKEGMACLTDGRRLAKLREETGADLVIVNGENASPSNGITADDAKTLLAAGADVITGGNHTFRHKNIYPMLDECGPVLRPANYPSAAPGCGYYIGEAKGYRVLVMNIAGCVYMDALASPFETADKLLAQNEGRYDIAVLDIHAEATSEKIALARYLDGRVSAVFGTHTHVQTADAQVLPAGTGYITDLGMCGSMNGVLGVKTDCIIHRFTVHTPRVFEPAEGNAEIHGALFEIDTATGKCVGVRGYRDTVAAF